MNSLKMVVVSIWAGLAGTLTAHAQAVTPIYSFTNGPAYPQAVLALGPDGNFYGMTVDGGNNGYGTVFRVTTDGTLTTLVNFKNTNGANPNGGLTLDPDGNFYGSTTSGGSNNNGTLFRLTTNGVLTTLVNFDGTNGKYPFASLTPGPEGNFYGTTDGDGSDGGSYGTVFKMTTNGTLTTLVSFNILNGWLPEASLLLGPDRNFYGVTYRGGDSDYGTVFKMTTDGTLTTLASFSHTNGAQPRAGLTLGPDGNFYGITRNGGVGGYGTVFKVTTNGTLTTLVSLSGTNGDWPSGRLALGPDGGFYGTTEEGGSNNLGVVFKVMPTGTLTRLVSFSGNNGRYPLAGLTLGPDGNFYGITSQGGPGYRGNIFRLDLSPVFITSPTNQSAVIGGSAIFNCQPFGTAPFAYQWLSNGIPINYATGSSLTVPNISPTTINAKFQVVVTNAWGSITSSVAFINLVPSIIGQPADQTVPIGSPALLSASVTGSLPLSCQWYFNSVLLVGCTNASLSIISALTNDIGNYQLAVTNLHGGVTSRQAWLNVLLQPNSYAVSNSGASNRTVYLGSYPNSTNRLWASTNLAQWQLIATNVTDVNGLCQFLDTNVPGVPQKFYLLSYP